MADTVPSLDESRNLPQWIRYMAEHFPARPLFAYVTPDSNTHLITWSEIGAAMERAACTVDEMFDLAQTSAEGNDKVPPVVGILANLDSITYHALYLGISRAGGVAFPISIKNSPLAIAHLLKKTGAHKLLVSADETTKNLALEALETAEQDGHSVILRMSPEFQDIFKDNDFQYTAPTGPVNDMDSPAVILHSSGSTSFPKPIIIKQRELLQWVNLSEIVGVDMSKHRIAVHAVPVYHGMGFFSLLWAARTGLTLSVFPPQSPPMIPSPASVLEAALASQSTFIQCVPLYIEIWSRDPDTVENLKLFTGVVFGGGPLERRVGDELTRLGVSLISAYGATEIGPVSLWVVRAPGDLDWDWMHISPNVNPKFLPQDDSITFELVLLECPTHDTFVPNAIHDGKRTFATNDIVIRHPNDRYRFKIVGRKDDQIMLSSGEKTNPGPIEAIIARSPFVDKAVMFGRGREQNGVIIQPAKGHEFDPADRFKLSKYRNDIWPSVEQANDFAPSHSRLFKEMILVTHPSRPMEITAKLTPRRAAILAAYANEIEATYNAMEKSAQSEIPFPTSWNVVEIESITAYVREIVHEVVDKQIEDEADIFEQGGDSLMATYIRNHLIKAVSQEHKNAARRIAQNFVYENPSIIKLAQGLLAIVNGTPGLDKNNLKLQEIEKMISELSMDFPEHRVTSSHSFSAGEVVLITGTTGGLGSQLLVYLAESVEVSRVYALNRKSVNVDRSLRSRQVEALIARGLDPSVIELPKVTLVECDTAAEGLAIDPGLYDEMRNSITLIIHNAWRVNFNLAFGAYKENMRGVRNLIDLALASPHHKPPRIIYLSSVGVFRNWNPDRGRPLESSIDDPRVVLGAGYAESKFVGERTLENAAKVTLLRPIIVRSGQLTSTPNGAWNTGDWLPAIVRSGQVLGVLPARSDCIAWISLETTAQAIFEFRYSSSQFLHIAHPNPVQWSTVFDVFSARLNLTLVPWSEWLAKLMACDGESERNPALFLLEFFCGCAPTAQRDREAPGTPLMDQTQALRTSRTLAHPSLRQIGGDDAERWLNHWMAVGFLSSD